MNTRENDDETRESRLLKLYIEVTGATAPQARSVLMYVGPKSESGCRLERAEGETEPVFEMDRDSMPVNDSPPATEGRFSARLASPILEGA